MPLTESKYVWMGGEAVPWKKQKFTYCRMLSTMVQQSLKEFDAIKQRRDQPYFG